MSNQELIRYWIPSFEINRKVITQELQYHLGPEATIRPYTQMGQDGYLISSPGPCLTDEQIDDICLKSREVWEKQAAARSKNGPNKDLKRPLHQPVIISRGSSSKPGPPESRHRHLGDRGEEPSRRSVGEQRRVDSSHRR
ncbi:hypothetical protein GLAREA_00497 [Glarea lozoyensis ATCC 20868]|uniref:Uncharacterized protein n=1 Tax=Glarea lozoyensis (strain ATCC 20868 / MF5171) TaxID=1116229 RepID=S3CSE3_GLAL2|nr:uncharacterized protein GLAREA_00497 [Glarea lozoyensis ATCC 20868]EPE29337.1 hypothetical protein GLAREA_00497 [Glarea lozoyensis ATCC 20868]